MSKKFRDEYILDDEGHIDNEKMQLAMDNRDFGIIIDKLNAIRHSCGFFDICPLGEAYKLVHDDSGYHYIKEYEYLSSLHCTRWSEMSIDTKNGLYKAILQLFECPRIGLNEKTNKFYDAAKANLSRNGEGSRPSTSEYPWWTRVFRT